MEPIRIPEANRRWDCLSLGEVMLRLDPGEGRIHTARQFQVWEGGGEYNVARGLRRCFGLRTAIATALAENPVGRLVEDLILQGGVDTSLLRWVPFDGVGRTVRNGLNFTERGLRRARGGGLLRSRPHRHQPGEARRLRLDVDFWRSGTARAGFIPAASLRRFRLPRRKWPLKPWTRPAQLRHAYLLRSQLPRFALEIHRRQSQSAGSEPRAGAQGRPAARQ